MSRSEKQFISCARVQTCDLEVFHPCWPSLTMYLITLVEYDLPLLTGQPTRVSIVAWSHCHTVLPSQNFMQFFRTTSFSWASPQKQDAVAKSSSTQTTSPTEAATISLGFSLFLWVLTLDTFWEAETCWNIKKPWKIAESRVSSSTHAQDGPTLNFAIWANSSKAKFAKALSFISLDFHLLISHAPCLQASFSFIDTTNILEISPW